MNSLSLNEHSKSKLNQHQNQHNVVIQINTVAIGQSRDIVKLTQLIWFQIVVFRAEVVVVEFAKIKTNTAQLGLIKVGSSLYFIFHLVFKVTVEPILPICHNTVKNHANCAEVF